jgi:hypothetical protein
MLLEGSFFSRVYIREEVLAKNLRGVHELYLLHKSSIFLVGSYIIFFHKYIFLPEATPPILLTACR